MGYSKSSRKQKPPSFFTEISFISMNLFFLKLYSFESFSATSFFSVMLPIMIYLVISLFGYLLKFIQMMHIEDVDESYGILSRKQMKLLT